MGQDDASRYRVIMEATRRALLDDIGRARSQIFLGVLMVLAGSAIAAVLVMVMLRGAPWVLAWGSFGVTPIPFGIARLARGTCTISASRRRLRSLDAHTALPVARVHAR
jgi:hypothetical protein